MHLFIKGDKGRKGTNAIGATLIADATGAAPQKHIVCKGFAVTRAAGSLHFLPLTSRLRGGLPLQVAAFRLHEPQALYTFDL